MDVGIFSGLWGGVSGTLALGAAEISEYTGSADKKRQQELALNQLSLAGLKQKAEANKQYILIAGIIIVIIALVIIKSRRQ
jgi:hypothetical protein